MPRSGVVGKPGTDDPQYNRLMKRIMYALDNGTPHDFWAALDKLRDYAALRKLMEMKDDA